MTDAYLIRANIDLILNETILVLNFVFSDGYQYEESFLRKQRELIELKFSEIKIQLDQAYRDEKLSFSSNYIKNYILPKLDTKFSDAQVMRNILKLFPCANKYAVCPKACPYTGRGATVMGVIMHLNDDHRWPRQKIADWLEQLDININLGEIDVF